MLKYVYKDQSFIRTYLKKNVQTYTHIFFNYYQLNQVFFLFTLFKKFHKFRGTHGNKNVFIFFYVSILYQIRFSKYIRRLKENIIKRMRTYTPF